jgi:hypothetical protein
MSVTRLGYTGTTPGADANTYLFFSTTGGTTTRAAAANANQWPQGVLSIMGADKFVLTLDHVQAGTLNSYSSVDNGTTWGQLSTEAIAAPAASGSTYREFNVEGLYDFKLEWVNGGVGQAPWVPQMALICGDRAAP